MKWWQKALVATVVLLIVDAGYCVVTYRHIQNTSISSEEESIRHEKLGEACGYILGMGLVAIWAGAYFKDKERRKRIR